PFIRRFVVTLARRIRKYDGGLVFATQNSGDLLSSDHGRVVAANSSLQFFGAQRPGEARRLAEMFNLGAEDRSFLEGARRGDFLISAAGDRIGMHVEIPSWQERTISGGAPWG
ncbi:MAG TPA: hypothetical protein VNL71_20035, partial [Chloroflexota bacterium]|nr:hypothetical protein [Chloroflexota bacterium]